MDKKQEKKRLRGARRMRQLGHVLVAVWFDPTEFEVVQTSADAANKPVATYVRETVFALSAANQQWRADPSQ